MEPQKVSGSGEVDIYVSHDPTWLIERLKLEDHESDKRFRLSLLEPADHANDVLLLDLRLFSGEADRELAFIKKLLPLCEKLTQDAHAWPGFAMSELQDIEQWSKSVLEHKSGGRKDRTYLVALTLLPRLLALSDLSLPIIICSSTTQRIVTEKLKPYGNIITSFAKPALFGYEPSDLVAHTNGSFFQAAVEQAFRICEARSLCRRLLTHAEENPPAQRNALPWAKHYELYVDESGSFVKPGDRGSWPSVLRANEYREKWLVCRHSCAGAWLQRGQSVRQGCRVDWL